MQFAGLAGNCSGIAFARAKAMFSDVICGGWTAWLVTARADKLFCYHSSTTAQSVLYCAHE
jgi:hypothetical protein